MTQRLNSGSQKGFITSLAVPSSSIIQLDHVIPRDHFICDRICKKGSYTRTTSTHRFHHHFIDTLTNNPCVHILWPTVHQSAFPEAAFWDMSDVHECPVCVHSSLLAVKRRLPGCKVSHDLVVILSTDLTTFWAMSSTSGSIIQV